MTRDPLSTDPMLMVNCEGQFALILWMLGFPDQAARTARENPLVRTAAEQHFVALQCHFLGDYRDVSARIDLIIDTSRENGFPYWLGLGLVRKGRLAVEQGAAATGIEMMLEGMRTLKAAGEDMTDYYFRSVLAEAYLAAKMPAEGLEAAATVIAGPVGFNIADVHRLRGELLLLAGAAPSEVEDAFRKAIAIARAQGGKSWELRATMNLARLLRDTGRRDEARKMLAEIYNWFTEGFDTADLRAAKALLKEL